MFRTDLEATSAINLLEFSSPFRSTSYIFLIVFMLGSLFPEIIL